MLKDKLKSLRQGKKITQEELADSLYVSRTLVAKWETGKRYPTKESLEEIAKFFGISFNELIKDDEETLVSIDELSECIPESSADDGTDVNDVLVGLLSKKINDFLKTLSKEERIIFIRRYYFYDKPEDISKMLKISLEEIKTTLTEVRVKLLNCLTKEGF